MRKIFLLVPVAFLFSGCEFLGQNVGGTYTPAGADAASTQTTIAQESQPSTPGGTSVTPTATPTPSATPTPTASASPSPSASPVVSNTVVFTIAAGTGSKPWNTAQTPIVAKVGQTLKIVNNDTIVHRLHTPGFPTIHEPANVAAGGTDTLTFTGAYTSPTNGSEGVTYDHDQTTAAQVYFNVTTPVPTP